jgi:hypothetical protein
MKLLNILLITMVMSSCTQRIKMTEAEIGEIVYSVEENETLSYASDEILSKLPKLTEKEIVDLYITIREEGKRHEITWRSEFISLTKIEEHKLPERYFLNLDWFLNEVKKDDDKEDCVNALVDFLLSEEVKESLEELAKKIKDSGEIYLLRAIKEYKEDLADIEK